jgi:hypothetical protein
MQRIKWYIKQLFPLTYRTTYTQEGKRHFTVWRMWMGRCYAVDDVVIAEG